MADPGDLNIFIIPLLDVPFKPVALSNVIHKGMLHNLTLKFSLFGFSKFQIKINYDSPALANSIAS